ncbi:MAG: hypothetical protein AAF327_02370 [Cyanobacteria bacterium P01_A01_bin.37]
MALRSFVFVWVPRDLDKPLERLPVMPQELRSPFPKNHDGRSPYFWLNDIVYSLSTQVCFIHLSEY